MDLLHTTRPAHFRKIVSSRTYVQISDLPPRCPRKDALAKVTAPALNVAEYVSPVKAGSVEQIENWGKSCEDDFLVEIG